MGRFNVNKLTAIQTKLRAPKSQMNKFGGYAYRSCEDILEALKPILAEEDCKLILKDDVVLIGERYYIKSTAELYYNDQLLGSSCGWAREASEAKGLSPAQISGSAASYARKYCVSALMLCDDGKDDDSRPPVNHNRDERTPAESSRLDLIKQNNILNAKKFQGDMQTKMLNTINDPKFNNVEGQETLAARIKEQLLKQTENLPPPKAKPTGAKDAHFSLG